jgi:hypothetical protein
MIKLEPLVLKVHEQVDGIASWQNMNRFSGSPITIYAQSRKHLHYFVSVFRKFKFWRGEEGEGNLAVGPFSYVEYVYHCILSI